MDQASITTIDISVKKKCVLILLNSNHLNPWIRIIEHLLRLIKVGNYRRKWLLYAVFVRIIFNTTRRDTMKKQQ